MKKHVLLLGVPLVFIIVGSCFAGQCQWQQLSSAPVSPVKSILLWKNDPSVILAGTDKAIYKSVDGGKNWRMALVLPGPDNSVNNFCFSYQDARRIWAATSNGLYYSGDSGNSWRRVFKGRNYLERQCSAVLGLEAKVLLGTASGLFESRDLGRTWQKSSAVKSNSNITALVNSEAEPQTVYMACSEGILKSIDSAKSWEKVYVTIGKEEALDQEEIEEADVERACGIRHLVVSPKSPQCLAASTTAGVAVSINAGMAWDFLDDYGLLEKDVYYLAYSQQNNPVAIISSGAFEHRQDRWRELTLDLLSTKIYEIRFDNNGNIFAACKEGLFRGTFSAPQNLYSGLIQSNEFKDEPDIEDVQKAAIKYAEVQPEKIKNWRKAAAKKAILPRITTSVGRNVTDLWHWETGSSTKNGDDVLVKGSPAIEWDISMSWDLSELIWNDAQASIDVRSRLMVELRNDILDEVTKLYFERQRVKLELENLPIEDRRRRLDKEIKLKELTANLDALTGGYFSKAMRNT